MDKLKAAFIGAGWWAAQTHIPVLARRPEVVLDGVSRLGAAELERVRTHFGIAFASEDYRELLARKPDIVVVGSPHNLHFEHASAALEAGAHVLCEKPMTLDPAEAWALVDLAERKGLHLLIANSYNFMPHVNDLRRRIAEGGIGRVEHAMSSFISVTRDVFQGDAGLRSWQTSFFRPDKATWQDPAQGGGFAHGQLSHSLALLFFVTGEAPVQASAYALDTDGVDLADAGAVRLANGAVASISGAAAMPHGSRALMRLFVAGSEGVMAIEFDRDVCEIRTNDGKVERLDIPEGGWKVDSAGPLDALVDLALGRGENLASGVVGARTTATIAAMLASARSGGAPVAVDGRAASR